MIDLKDLKACRCGNRELVDAEGWDFGNRFCVVWCPKCGFYGPFTDSIATAREKWNKRAGEKA